MREQIKKLMKENGMVANHEAEAAIYFVADLLLLYAEDTEKNEPYATESINDARKASSRVHDLYNFINDFE